MTTDEKIAKSNPLKRYHAFKLRKGLVIFQYLGRRGRFLFKEVHNRGHEVFAQS
jgi:hypothetical protein